MAVKLTLGDPSVVAQGGSYADLGWGAFQFPGICRADDGRFLATYHGHPDSVNAYGKPNPIFVSDDGLHWVQTEDETLIGQFAVKLPSGDRLAVLAEPPVLFDADTLPESLNQRLYKHLNAQVFLIDDLPGHPFEHKWPFKLMKAGEKRSEKVYSDVDWPNMFVNAVYYEEKPGFLPPFAINGHIRVAPDKSVWCTVEERCAVDPVNGGFNPFYCIYYFRSDDNCRSFRFVSWLPYSPDTRENPNAFFAEGFNEADLAFMPDGSMITVVRTDPCAPSYIARSTDGGKSWSHPRIFDRIGVWPNLCRLDNGVTLCSYGRPGLFVRATDDTAGMQWDTPVEIVAGEMSPDKAAKLKGGYHSIIVGADDNGTPQPFPATCGYSGMVPVSEDSALLIYSDFNYPDDTGKPVKTILTRLITAERTE